MTSFYYANEYVMRNTFSVLIYFLVGFVFFSCKPAVSQASLQKVPQLKERLVLAQWSFNRELFKGEMSTFDFIRTAKEMDFVGVEYVNQFFMDHIEDSAYLDSLRTTAEEVGIKNTLLMIDRAGNLGASKKETREEAVANHKKWILAAKKMNCPNIRINAHGDGSREEIYSACQKSILELSDFGQEHNVGILIENHGSYSSDGNWLSELVKKVNRPNVASLADFDNWCIERENGELWGAPCIKEYDRYVGMKQLLPTAKSVSIKAFDFDKDGLPIKTDFKKMFELIFKSGYEGYLAVEFEGHEIDAKIGIQKTKALAERFYITN